MTPETIALFAGLASAVSWGAGDFVGGLASRRAEPVRIAFLSHLVGLFLVFGLALLLREPLPPRSDLLWGGAAGLAGAVGLTALYRGFAAGKMSVVAPVAALVTGALPILFGLLTEGLPDPFQMAGFALALAAVWIISRADDDIPFSLRDLAMPLLAGLGFGVFLTLIGYAGDAALFWPLAAARTASVTLLAVFVLIGGRRPGGWAAVPRLLVVLAGLGEIAGNALFALAAQVGRLDVAAVLGSLYPAATVLLARLILDERLSRRQGFGVVLALIAVVLIAL